MIPVYNDLLTGETRHLSLHRDRKKKTTRREALKYREAKAGRWSYECCNFCRSKAQVSHAMTGHKYWCTETKASVRLKMVCDKFRNQ